MKLLARLVKVFRSSTQTTASVKVVLKHPFWQCPKEVERNRPFCHASNLNRCNNLFFIFLFFIFFLSKMLETCSSGGDSGAGGQFRQVS